MRSASGGARPNDGARVIVSLHVATGAAAGAAAGSRLAGLALGLLIHLLGDWMPHQDIASRRFEIRSGVISVLLLAAARGPLDAATVGAIAASAPDLEHVIRLPRPGGRKLFPSHRFPSWHRSGGIPASLQLIVAGSILGWLLASGGASRARGRG